MSSITSRKPFVRSVRSVTSAIPCSFLLLTPSLIFSITFSGPTRYGSSVTTIPSFLGETLSTETLARVLKVPRPVSYASMTPSRPIIMPPLGRSGPGTNFMSCFVVASGFPRRNIAPLITSRRLCGGMLVAIPTAIPEEPFTSRFGKAAGSTSGSVSCAS